MLGELLSGRYRVVNILGAGGFGHTYIAEDTQRPGSPRCVLKHLTFATGNPAVLQQVRRLFQSEAEVLERLGKHPQIPRLLAYFEQNQEFYLVQEFIEGHPLSEELTEGVRWQESQVVSLLEEVLGILQYVHGQNVIHRDIKPDNLMRRSDGKLVLIDFGAVKTISNVVTEASGTTTLSVPIYTFGYGASEQCMGRPRYSSDLYSLGMIAIQALTGLRPSQLPQDANTMEVVWRDHATVSEPLAAVLDQMTRYHANQRYQSATEALQALHPLIAGSPTRFPSEETVAQPKRLLSPPAQLRTEPPRFVKPTSFHRWAWLGAGSLIAIGVVALVRPNLPAFRNRASPSVSSSTSPASVTGDRISQGEELLNQWQPNVDKQEGVQQFAAGNYDRAIRALRAARQKDPTDPETLIYLNNAQIGTAKAYTIAVAVPFRDAFGTAQEVLRGVAQAQDATNRAGGIRGVPLKIAIANDDNQAETARQLATQFSQDPAILAVVGHSISDTTLATAEIYQANQLVMVSPLSSAVQLANQGSYIFRTIPSDRATAKALSDYMLNRLKKRKAFVLYNSTSAYSQSLKNEFKNALFYNNVSLRGEFDLSRPDFDPYDAVKQATANGAEVLVLAGDHTTSDRVIQVVLTNRRRMPLLAGEAISMTRILNVAGSDSVGMVVAIPSALKQPAFQQQFRVLWHSRAVPGWRTALSYDAAMAIITAMQKDPTRSGIQRTLASQDFAAPGADGAVKFLPTGDRDGTAQLMTVVAQKVGKQTHYEFRPVR